MPIMDGYAATKKLSKLFDQNKLSPIPIIAFIVVLLVEMIWIIHN